MSARDKSFISVNSSNSERNWRVEKKKKREPACKVAYCLCDGGNVTGRLISLMSKSNDVMTAMNLSKTNYVCLVTHVKSFAVIK